MIFYTEGMKLAVYCPGGIAIRETWNRFFALQLRHGGCGAIHGRRVGISQSNLTKIKGSAKTPATHSDSTSVRQSLQLLSPRYLARTAHRS